LTILSKRRKPSVIAAIAVFLLGLAEWTTKLTPLTSKDANKLFPTWTANHQLAFDNIKNLVLGAECLTTIDHMALGDNKIFVTCDASDWCTGAALSYGPSWEIARPVAFN
jgi:RNase H-like domain found in reverse transcriptase